VAIQEPELAWDLVQNFLAAEFSEAPRHLRRLSKVAALEAGEGIPTPKEKL
jgi:ribose 5-phosphate isomerase RpiB